MCLNIENTCIDNIFIPDDVSMTLEKIVLTKTNKTEFRITVQTSDEIYKVQVSANGVRRTKFLQDIPFGDVDEEELYEQLRKKIFEKQFYEEEILFQTDQNGLQKVNNKWAFVFSNGCICEKGFNPRIYSGVDGYYIPPEAVIEEVEVKGVIKDLFREYNHNSRVFYPLFLLNLMSITNGYFRMIGESQFMKITLWLGGNSGSGKTELAKTVGTYLFCDKELNNNIICSTARRNYVLKYLGDSSGSVFLFDDVKKEAVRDRKNSVAIKIDDILRSVFNGRLTDVINQQSLPPLIDACALITGEFMQTQESQNARLLYLNVDGFLKNEKNSETLRILQKNSLWLTAVCCDYMKWLLTKIGDNTFQTLLKEKLKELREGKKRYGAINNAARLNENRYMVEMSCYLLKMYFKERNLTREFICRCEEMAELALESLCNNTFSLLGGEEMVVQRAMCDVMKNCEIRKARYQYNKIYIDSGCKYRQDYFMLHDDDDILFIEDYEETLLRNTHEQHDLNVGKPYLIIKEEKLMNLLYKGINEVLNDYPVSCISADEIIGHLPKLLKKMQLIYKQRRSDGDWGRTAVKYPVCKICDEPNGKYNWGEPDIEARCIVEFKPVVQLNIEHPDMDILMERIDDDPGIEKVLKDVDVICDVHREEIKEGEIYKIRKAFMSSKTLYKK